MARTSYNLSGILSCFPHRCRCSAGQRAAGCPAGTVGRLGRERRQPILVWSSAESEWQEDLWTAGVQWWLTDEPALLPPKGLQGPSLHISHNGQNRAGCYWELYPWRFLWKLLLEREKKWTLLTWHFCTSRFSNLGYFYFCFFTVRFFWSSATVSYSNFFFTFFLTFRWFPFYCCY